MSALQAFFYLRDAEQMPENAPDSWFLQPDPVQGLTERVDTFETHARLLIEDLSDLEGEEAFQFAFYERAKAAFGTDGASIREFFRMLYLVVLDQPSGPRWGQFVALTGREEFIERLRSRLDNPAVI